MKRILFFLFISSLLFSQDLSYTNYRWKNNEIENKYQFTLNYGPNIASHLFLEKRYQFNDKISMAFGAVLSSQNDIGVTFERQDFPLFSTGRFYHGEMILNFDKINFNIGRHVYDQDPLLQNSIWNDSRLTGDGINWKWNFTGNWSFENSIEFLPNEKDTLGQYFERVLNHHAITWNNKIFEFSVGEISIYSGINQSINWRQSNPFLPYVFHYVDSYDRTTPSYRGDNENVIITLGLKFDILKNFSFQTKIYIDDIQIDTVDRKRIADIFLLYNEFHYNYKNIFRGTFHFTLSNPAMAWHKGPYTSLLAYGYELLPHEYGEIYSYGLKINYKYKFFESYLNISSTYKAIIAPDIQNLYLKSVQNELEKKSLFQIDFKCGFYLLENIAIWGHLNYRTDNEIVYNFILQTYF